MRFLTICTAALAIGVAAPAMAQNSGQVDRVLGRVLDSLLGPQQETAEVVEEVVQQDAGPTMAQVLAHPRRGDDAARDQYRHPAETLAFFDVRPGMKVVDYMPAGGWYSRVLIPYLGEQGTYVGLNPELHPSLTGYWDMYRGAATRIPADAQAWVGDSGGDVFGLNTDDDLSAHAGTADRVLIFREIHNMRRFGWFHDSMVAARTLLKPDGLVGVVQHRADPDAPASYVLGDNGYQREEDVIALFSAYGFDLVSRSEINANDLDPANWEGGVWSLGPSFGGAAEGSRERRRRAAIGESDRMTLLFRKRP